MASGDKDVEFHDPPHTIAEKISVGGPGAVTPSLLERTDRNLAVNFGNLYADWLADDIAKLEACMAAMSDGIEVEAPPVADFRDCVHELRGMGGTFDYHLVTAIGDQMYRLVANTDEVDGDFLVALGVHLDALKLIAAEQLKGDGGERGREILEGLQKVYAKYA